MSCCAAICSETPSMVLKPITPSSSPGTHPTTNYSMALMRSSTCCRRWRFRPGPGRTEAGDVGGRGLAPGLLAISYAHDATHRVRAGAPSATRERARSCRTACRPATTPAGRGTGPDGRHRRLRGRGGGGGRDRAIGRPVDGRRRPDRAAARLRVRARGDRRGRHPPAHLPLPPTRPRAQRTRVLACWRAGVLAQLAPGAGPARRRRAVTRAGGAGTRPGRCCVVLAPPDRVPEATAGR
ncbi:hypothetical protein FBY22_3516 [Streptomyces sp. SLBN-31]|nr:hypothetical protein FBY22_3516 [Streptomyces sp. SLBN-31]